MHRRGNKSKKARHLLSLPTISVPNVKLRPAQPKSSSSKRKETEEKLWAEETQLGSEDTSYMDPCPRPFLGMVICATGIQDKARRRHQPALFKKAIELGAQTASAFTDRVTHLVAKDHGGAKYNCALQLKIPILQPKWITECHEVWLRGDDFDVQESLEKYRLPVFSGIILSISGITDLERRTQINRLLIQQKGVYAKELTRPVKVTHLLCSGDDETDKMKYAEKFNQNKEANIHLVWEEWFWDSLEFGGRFDEETYQVRRPRPERKSITEPPASSSPATDPEPTMSLPNNVDDEEEPASINRVPAVTVKVWQSLLQHRGYEVSSEGRLVRSPMKSQPTKQLLEDRPSSPTGESIITKFRRANSFAPPKQGSGETPFARSNSEPVAGPSSIATTSTLFTGIKFCALGEAKSASVKDAIERSGGSLTSEEDDADYILVRLVSGSKFFARRWIRNRERSIARNAGLKGLYLRRDFVILKIMYHSHLSESKCLYLVLISFSGLDESEAYFTRRLVRALGMTLAPVFSRQATHLLCPSATGAKYDKAREWGVPVIHMGWLAEAVRIGSVPDVPVFLVASMSTDKKGKGKADDDSAMVDITNATKLGTEPPSQSSARGQKGLGSDLEPSGFQQALEACPQSSFRRPQDAPVISPPKPSFGKPRSGLLSSNIPGSVEREQTPVFSIPLPIIPSGGGDSVPKPSSVHTSPPNLLGKRKSEEGPVVEKRLRPRLRSRPRSRQESARDIAVEVAALTDRVAGFDEAFDELGGEGLDSDVVGSTTKVGALESMRVMYEDPGQREEKRKLLNLLSGGNMQELGTTSKGQTRASGRKRSRVAGV
ncbi:uncharacterized protein EV420DRAFT_1474679 [Desarmillaria tabescens]|uniref:BRCT domain-containing protein n=1 Tax=Armillaria tabescens TaxID=1929756 RepID=A0AA39TQW3_ARMTA|nr:uncharacterized protein EV420DRAFT_1474679 [Desarmillaria tabescens]KAK0467367.1 hypothetical protein EV420DRAFT_1474679 [Desarmillaria tabescens]